MICELSSKVPRFGYRVEGEARKGVDAAEDFKFYLAAKRGTLTLLATPSRSWHPVRFCHILLGLRLAEQLE